MEEYQEIKGTTAIFFQLAYSSTTFRNENGTFKKYAFGSDLLELIVINESDKDAYSMGFENGKKKNTRTYIHTYVFFSMTEKGASGNENGKKKTFHFFFSKFFPKCSQMRSNFEVFNSFYMVGVMML